jgi:hypothetical protein
MNGVKKLVEITLPQEEWDRIAELQEQGLITSVSRHFAHAHICKVDYIKSMCWRTWYSDKRFGRKSLIKEPQV